MIIVVCGTNRPQAHSRKLAELARSALHARFPKEEIRLIDCADAKPDLASPQSYDDPPAWFEAWLQEPILKARSLVFVVPEYNGSFPGILKLAIDHLDFPRSLRRMPCCIIGCSGGQGGGVRASEHLGSVLAYRRAHLFGERALVPEIQTALRGPRLKTLKKTLADLLGAFGDFADQIAPGA